MSELINDQAKREFKRFFEYAFKSNPQYWQGLPGWEILGKIRTAAAENSSLNKLITSVIQSEESLKRIITDPSLDSAKELKYYAYLFLKEMDEVDGLQEPKLPVASAPFIEIYDQPNRLLEIVKDSSKPTEIRQQALNRLQELMPWSKLPNKVFDREVFNRSKWDEWFSRSTGLDGRGEYKNIDRNLYHNKIKQYAEASDWHRVGLYVEGYVTATGAKPNDAVAQPSSVQPALDYNSLVNRLYGILRSAHRDSIHHGFRSDESEDYGYCRYFADMSRDRILAVLSSQSTFFFPTIPRLNTECTLNYLETLGMRLVIPTLTQMLQACLANLDAAAAYAAYQQKLATYNLLSPLVDNKYREYRQQQDQEFPALLVEYERSLEPASFPDSPLLVVENFSGDPKFVFIKDRLGDVRAKDLWSSPEAIKEVILQGDPDYPYKAYLYLRLKDIYILTINEARQLGLKALHRVSEPIDIIYGDTATIEGLVDSELLALNAENLNNKKEDL